MKLTIKTPEDLVAERAQALRDAARAKARAYLASTDWLVVRQAETGVPVPDEALVARAKARAALND